MKQERTLSVAVEGLLPSVVVPVGHLVSFRASDDAIEVLVGGAVLELRSAPFVVHVGAGVDVVPTTGKVAEAIATPPLSEQLRESFEAMQRRVGELQGENSRVSEEKDRLARLHVAVFNYLGVNTGDEFAAWYAARSEEVAALTEANLRLHEEHAAAIALLEEKTAPALPDAPAPPVAS